MREKGINHKKGIILVKANIEKGFFYHSSSSNPQRARQSNR